MSRRRVWNVGLVGGGVADGWSCDFFLEIERRSDERERASATARPRTDQ